MEKIELEKGVVYEFDPQIYPRKLWIAVGTDTFKDRFSNVSEWNDSFYAVVDDVCDDMNGNYGVLIRFTCFDSMTTSVITHESIHVALNIYDYCDVHVDTKNQEHLCYFAGWVAKCCGEVLKAEQERLTNNSETK